MPANFDRDLFNYQNFGEFLKSYVEHKKLQTKHFSYTVMAKQLGLRSASLLTMVARQERHPSQQLLEKCCKYFQFTQRERSYLQDLTFFNRSKAFDEKYQLAKNLQKYKIKNQSVNFEIDSVISAKTWLSMTLIEMSEMHNFNLNPVNVRNILRFPTSSTLIDHLISYLVSRGYLLKSSKKALKKAEPEMSTSEEVSSAAIKIHHHEMCMMAAQQVFEQDVASRCYSSSMIAIPKEKIELAKQLIKDFRTSFIEQVSIGEKDHVYHLGMQFFAMTK